MTKGELIQIDGSHHDWFEGRRPKCCLLVFIDDATGRLMNLRFSETESVIDYMVTTREYVEAKNLTQFNAPESPSERNATKKLDTIAEAS